MIYHSPSRYLNWPKPVVAWSIEGRAAKPGSNGLQIKKRWQ